MKIINLEEFRKMKPGTIFSKYEPCCFSDIMSKGETWEHDFLYDSIINDVKSDGSDCFVDNCTAMENGESKPLDVNATTRDGMFDSGQLFAIYEVDDLKQLIEKLRQCLKEAY